MTDRSRQDVPAAPAPNVSPVPWGTSHSYEIRVAVLGVYQVVLACALLYLIFVLWPQTVTDESGGGHWSDVINIGAGSVHINDDARLILLVICTGALGSYVHATTSFVSYVGNRRLLFSWAWWYLLRPFIGMALALIFYFVIRGGLLATSASTEHISPFGIAAVAGLVGMFSKQATDKLRELFDNLFKTEHGQGDDARADKLGANLPVASEMIERDKMVVYAMKEGQGEKDVRLVDLHRLLVGVVTRIPVVDHADVAKCVIHQSILYKYLADQSIEAARNNVPFEADKFSLADFLAAPGIKELVQDSMSFVQIGAMLADVKDRMAKIKNCKDVFVTEHGLPSEAIRGWLTDADMLRYSKV